MAEDFTAPIGIRSENENETWSLTVDADGNFAVRSNSPVGGGQPRLTIEDDSGRVAIGTGGNPAELAVTNAAVVEDGDRVRVRISAAGQRVELLNANSDIIGMIGGAGNIRAGSNGEGGDLFLFPAGATSIFADADATVSLNGESGSAAFRDGNGGTRARISAPGQRVELLNRAGDIIGMIGGAGNIRAGSNGEGGDLFLFPAGATSIFADADATVSLNGETGSAAFRDGNGGTRARISAAGQRVELLNADGEIIGMIGGAGNIRAGSNGEGGDLFLFPASASDIFDNAQATIHLNAETGDIRLSGADCAENFDLAEGCDATPGTLLVLAGPDGLRPCEDEYDGRVAGIVSGAGDFRPGMILDSAPNGRRRAAIALMGKAFCLVDASTAPVAVGDLLTTSATPGHAMKATDRARAAGAVVGKAMAPLAVGRGLVPVLVGLR